MSKERIKISPDLYDIMPSDYQDLGPECRPMAKKTVGGRTSAHRRS